MEQTLIVTKLRADGSLISASRVDGARACAINSISLSEGRILVALRISRDGLDDDVPEYHILPGGGALTIEAL